MDFTQFYESHSDINDIPGFVPPTQPQHIAIKGLATIHESLVLVWARFLTHFSSNHELVFHTNDATAQVNTNSWEIAYPRVSCFGTQSEAHTGVFTKKEITNPRCLTLWLEYDSNSLVAHLYWFPREDSCTFQELKSRLEESIRWTRKNSNQRLMDTERLPGEMKYSILNAAPQPMVGANVLHKLVNDNISPGHCAIDFLDQDGTLRTYTYQSLRDQSDKWAHVLVDHFERISAGPNPTVPVLMPQSPELYIALLAILKAGGNFCTLSLDAPQERIDFIVQDVSARLLLTSESQPTQVVPQTVEIISFGLDRDKPEREIKSHLPIVQTTDLAYVMYTSGSTGTPKGVGISHGAVCQSLLAHERHIPQFSRFLQFAAPTFDVSIFEIFFPLLRGCTLVACDRSSLLYDLPGVMQKMNVDAAELTPTVAGTLLKTRAAVPQLKLLLTIGEMLTPHVVNEFGANDSEDSILWGMYGPTECAIHCTLQPTFSSKDQVGNIGYPLDTVSALILAPASTTGPTGGIKILPLGEIGELAIGGHQLAVGYLNRKEQTNLAFIETSEYGTIYRTGDKAKIRDDGRIECFGRLSSGQVKLRGQRVELGEIEQAALRLDQCRTAIASVISGILVLFCHVSTDIGANEILGSCRRWLPEFMVPGDVVLVHELPQLPSGKVDRKALERDYTEKRLQSYDAEFDEDADVEVALLQRVLHCCQIVLGNGVKPSTRLAAAGLDSLNAIRLASALRSDGFQIGTVDLFEIKNVKKLATYLKSKGNLKPEEVSSAETAAHERLRSFLGRSFLGQNKSKIQDVLPCTPLQEAMLSETAVDSIRYCNWVELEFTREHTIFAIRQAFEQLITNTETLRTGFYHDSEWRSFVQIIWQPSVKPRITTASSFSRDYSLDTPQKLLQPLGIQICTTKSPPRVLVQIPHHVYDGWSLELMLEDLSSILRKEAKAERTQFSQVTKYLTIEDRTSDLSVASSFWQGQVKDFRARPLPVLCTPDAELRKPHVCSRTMGSTYTTVGQEARKLGISPQVYFQAALSYLLGVYTGSTETVLGVVTSGRSVAIPGIESVIGPCIATLPSRTQVRHSQNIQQVLIEIQALNRRAVQHSILPLREIKKLANVPLGMAMFDVIFAWQQTTRTYDDMQRLAVKQIRGVDYLESKLMVELEPTPDHIKARATFDPNVLSRAVVESLLMQLDTLSAFFIQNSHRRLDNFTESLRPDDLSITKPLDMTSIPHPIQSHFERAGAGAIAVTMQHNSAIPVVKNGLGEIVFCSAKRVVAPEATLGGAGDIEILVRTGQLGRILGDGHIMLTGDLAETEEFPDGATIDHMQSSSDDGAEWTSVERLIATALADCLDISISGIEKTSSFAKYGLDSLIAISMSKALRQLIGRHVPVSLILQNPTTAALASHISDDSGDADEVSGSLTLSVHQVFSGKMRDSITSRLSKSGLEVVKILPCTPLQEAMLATEIRPSPSTYVNRMIFQVQGDLERLRHAWETVCDRHEILRTCFVPTDDARFTYAQAVLHSLPMRWISETIADEELQHKVQITVQTISEIMRAMTGPPLQINVFNTPTRKYLSFCCHHALYDAEAMSIILSDVEDLYHGKVIPPSTSYETFLDHMLSTDIVKADEFWSRHLADFDPAPFPYLNGKSSSWRTKNSQKTMITVDLGPPYENVLNRCKESSVTLLCAAQAAWYKMLSNVLGGQDICFGNVFSGRTTSADDLDRLAAPCFNTLPVRIKTSLDTQNIDLMRSLQRFNAEVLPYQLTPLRRVQSATSSPGRQLFDTLFILQRPAKDLDDRIWTITEDVGFMDFPLVGEVTPRPATNSITLTIHHDRAYLLESDARALAQTFASALLSCVTQPSAPILDFTGLQRDLLSISNPQPRILQYNQTRYLHSAFEENASLNRNAIALSFSWRDGRKQTWSFSELNEIANSIAHDLLDMNVQVGDAVPVHVSKSPMFYASILGVLKVGAVYTPIAPSLPKSRKQYMLEELGANIVICESSSSLRWYPEIATLVLSESRQRLPNNPVIDGLHDGCLAYRIYTSGSTGKPKAVSVEHKSPKNTIESSRDIIPWNKDSRLLQYAATTFDMCYYDCFLAWSFGFCLCSAEQTLLLNKLENVIKDDGITLLDLTPSVARTLDPSHCPSVRYLYCIGEPMTQEIVDRWPGKCVNSYGPTEAAFCCTIQQMEEHVSPAVIGRPFPSASFFLYTQSGQAIIPVLGVGELYIGGAQVAREYHANEELTQRHFIDVKGEILYKSGDLARMLTNGTFEFIGRYDNQVKIRGLRIELEEITTVVRQSHSSIRAAATQVLPASEGDKEHIVSFIQCHSSANNHTDDEIIQIVKKSTEGLLPSYMVPSFFLCVRELPLSAAGKMDKKALTTIFHQSEQGPVALQKEEKSWTQLQSEIRNIFATLARVESATVSHDTTIYQLGLDSINAVQIASKIRDVGHDILAEHVLRYPTCDSLSTLIEGRSMISPVDHTYEQYDFKTFDHMCRQALSSSTQIDTKELSSIRPCTPLQNGLLAKFVQSEGEEYFNSFTMLLDSHFTVCMAKKAWAVVCENHEMLRVGFVNLQTAESHFCMVSHEKIFSEAMFISGDDGAGRSAQDWHTRYSKDIVQALYLPPWRITAVESEEGVRLHLHILHALYDAQSLQAIMSSFAKAIQAQPVHLEPSIEPILGSILQSSILTEDSKSFWKQMRENLFINRFPNLHPLQVSSSGKRISTSSASITLRQMEMYCQTASITLQAAAQAAWTRILASYIGEQSITFGVVLSGRTSYEAEKAVFPCFTTVPFTSQNQSSNRDLLRQTMETNISIREYQFTPLSDIQRLTGYSHQPLFDTLFAYQKLSGTTDIKLPWKLEAGEATDNHSVSIELEPNQDGGLQFRLTYESSLLPDEQAAIILRQFDAILIDLVKNPDGAANDLYRDDPQIHAITPPKDPEILSDIQLLHEFVEQSAVHHPKRIALEFATGFEGARTQSNIWSYEELNRQGNRIANLLIKRGIRPGNLVAICFDKCPEAYFSILGILKAGGAYVAIDPTAPIARKTFIYEDSGAQLLLSTRAFSRGIDQSSQVTLINIDDEDLTPLSTDVPKLARSISPQDRSYCLYTSGTTGTPKGCELTHENAVQAMLSFQRLFSGHWNESSRWLQFASFHFDVSVLEQYWSWSVGIRVVSAPRDLLFEDLTGSIRRLEITHIDLTPSLARIVYPDNVPDLCRGVFITGGEQLRQDILDVWGPKRVIYNGYGPTEATIGCTMYPRVPANGKPSNIGPAFDNVGSFVLAPGTDTPVLRGAVGELCVSGKLVGKGYLNRVDLTAEKFPTLKYFNERVYRTGDLVRILHDGTFDFIGRSDDQVKLRGQRLEIGEINSVIRNGIAEIEDVTTLVLKHEKQEGEQLVSFVVTKRHSRSKEQPNVAHEAASIVSLVNEECQNHLAAYMVPTHVIPMTTIPLSVNNKADAKRLRQIYNELSRESLQQLSGVADSKPLSNTEEKILKAVSSLVNLNGSEPSRKSSIFELGLDSITVISLSRKLKELGFRLASPVLIMRNPSIGRLATVLEDAHTAHLDSTVLEAKQSMAAIQHKYKSLAAEVFDVKTENIEAIAPCTPLQQGMISGSLRAKEKVYFNTFEMELSATIDLERLELAWTRVFEEVQILRTRFMPTNDGHIQVVVKSESLPYIRIYVSDSSDMNSVLNSEARGWREHNSDAIVKPFQIILATSPSRMIMSVHLFHAIYDGNSLPKIFDCAISHYQGRGPQNHGSDFIDALPYGPLRKVPGARGFFEEHLFGITSQRLPRLDQNQDVSKSTTTSIFELNERYHEVKRALGVTDQAIIQACWAAVIQTQMPGSATLGMVVSGRTLEYEHAEQTIGPLFNTIPFHIQFNDADTWRSVVSACHDFNIGVVPYQHTPLRDVLKWTKRHSGIPLFENLLVFQKETSQEGAWDSNSLWRLMAEDNESDYPLALEVLLKNNDTLKITLAVNCEVFDEQDFLALLSQFERALESLIKTPQALLSDTVGPIQSVATSNEIVPIPSREYRVDETFTWTHESDLLRHELAELASVDASAISAKTSIFDLGLDSIDAISLSSRLRRHGLALPVSIVMRHLTLGKLSEHLSRNPITKQVGSDLVPAVEETQKKLDKHIRTIHTGKGIEMVLPATPLQESMVAEMHASNFERYFNHDVLRLSPETDVDRLKKAWEDVARGNPILRTTFLVVESTDFDISYAQVVYPFSKLDWNERSVAATGIDQILGRINSETAASGIGARLFQLNLLTMTSKERYLVLSIAHALYDGWSLGLLHDRVGAAYDGNVIEDDHHQEIALEILSSSTPNSADFWRDYLSDKNTASFPTRRTPDNGSEQLINREELRSAISLPNVHDFCKRQGISMQTLSQTCWALVLASYSHSLDVTFGVVLSGRDGKDSIDSVFPTMNTIPVRSVIHGTGSDLLHYMQANTTNLRSHQHDPLRKVQAAVRRRREDLFDTLFIYQRRPESSSKNAKPLYESVGGKSDIEYPIAAEMEATDGVTWWRCACKNAYLDIEGAKALLQRLDTILMTLVDDPSSPVLRFSDHGTSICGLPPFKEEQTVPKDQSQNNEAAEEISTSMQGRWTDKETIVRTTLAQVAQISDDEISRSTSIFQLGLDSISAIKISSLLRKNGLKVNVSDLLKAGSCANIALLVDNKDPIPSSTDNLEGIVSVAIKEKGVDSHALLKSRGYTEDDVCMVAPATAGQIYMLVQWKYSEGHLFYPSFHFELSGATSLQRLEEAWEVLVDEQPILRTVFIETKVDAMPFIQVTLNKGPGSFGHLETGSEQPFVNLSADQTRTGWDLRIKIHHALYDGVSLPLLMARLGSLCHGDSEDLTRSTSLLAFASLYVGGEALAEQKSFWTRYFHGIASNTLYLPRPTAPPSRRIEVFRPHAIPLLSPLRQLARQYDITLQSILLAAYAKTYLSLHHHSPKPREVIIGIYLANRSHSIDTASAPIPTVSVLPLRIHTSLPLLSAATAAHADLQALSRPVLAAASLADIFAWTGVRVDTFVNYIRLPDIAPLEDSAAQATGADITITSMDGEVRAERARVVDLEPAGEASLAAFEETSARVRDAYLHALDIEIAEHGDALDVGAFCAEGMLDVEEADGVIKGLREELEKLME